MNSSNLSIYAQTPQYIILGLSQAFGLLASIQFAYFIAPRSAKSLFMSLHYISRITAEYIADEFMTYLLTTSSEVNFSVSIKTEQSVFIGLRSMDISSVRTMNDGTPMLISISLLAFRYFSLLLLSYAKNIIGSSN